MIKLSISQTLTFIAVLVITLAACHKDVNSKPEVKFSFTKHYVAGTITPVKGSKYNSVYMITFQNDTAAQFISASSIFDGRYRIEKDTLIFEVPDVNNYRIAKFAINSKHELTSSYYRALTLEYGSTGKLLPNPESNQLAGKSFKGDQYKMGEVLNIPGFTFKFKSTGSTYGSGSDASVIDNSANPYNLYNNAAFRSVNGNVKEMGVLIDGKLVAFKVSGLYYYGSFSAQ